MQDDTPRSPMQDAMRSQLMRQTTTGGSIASEHQMVRDLCMELEAIADRLPQLPRSGEVEVIVAALRAGVPAHCRHEEAEFRYRMVQRREPSRALVVAIERLAAEHSDNEPLGYELADALENAVVRKYETDAGALGYLIRLYFQTMRRHLMWEEFVLNCLMQEDGVQTT